MGVGIMVLSLAYGIHMAAIFILPASSQPTGVVACPPDWMPWSGRCYHRLHSSSNGTWHDSRVACQRYSGDIATVGSPNENWFLKEAIFGESEINGGPVWLGCLRPSDDTMGNITGGNGTSKNPASPSWTCLDEDGEESESKQPYTNWKNTFPKASVVDSPQCVVMTSGGYWENTVCSVTMGTVCEAVPEDCKVQDMPEQRVSSEPREPEQCVKSPRAALLRLSGITLAKRTLGSFT